MTKHIINPAKADEIVKELFNTNKDIIDEFSKYFAEDIMEFAEKYTAGYKKHSELNRLAIDTTNKQRAYVSGLSYMMFENLFTSFKLFMLGYHTPSGNLMRQVIESIALTILCSLDFNIVINKSKTKNINFFESFYLQKPEANSNKAIFYLEMNIEPIGIKQHPVEVLKSSRKFYHQYSHPSMLSMANILSFQSPGTTYIGGSFDVDKKEGYKKELAHRINLCKILPDFIDGLILRIKKLSTI